MKKRFDYAQLEPEIYGFWEQNHCFEATLDTKKEPFCIIFPPPNANAELHLGHAMYVYEDIMVRYNKLIGKSVLWVPGFDHAGFETQFVFEKHLKKQGKSRFNYDRETLYKMIWDFVEENKPKMRHQLKRLGFSFDWSKEQFTMNPQIVATVYKTFKKMFDDKLIYRKERLVNYCTNDGTSFSDLEVVYQERIDPLYYIKYGPFVLATVRPETKFGDTAVAVHPSDKRYQAYIGKEIEVEGLLGPFKLKVVADEAVDPTFGTGVVKVTPAHDHTDYEIAMRHGIPLKQVIGFDGRLNDLTGPYKGMKVMEARKKVAEDMEKKGLIEKINENYTHRVGTCYKCGRVIEPLPLEQWFVNIRPLADKAKNLIEKDTITFFPKKYKRQAVQILDGYIDWNISRQIVWGIRIPAFRHTKTSEWIVETDPVKQAELIASGDYIQDTDTFDTWFSSGQWPFATLQNMGKEYFDYFYPTSVMETGHDILRAWVSRMIMLGHFRYPEQGREVPFKHVFLHGMVRDKHGQKMSKSKGNVVNPIEFMDKYGTDALRAALIFGTKDGGDTSISEEKVIGMRNFANKIWNIGRFLWMGEHPEEGAMPVEGAAPPKKDSLKGLKKESQDILKKYKKHMAADQFSKAFDLSYHFLWHRFADFYIEELKDNIRSGDKETLSILKDVYLQMLVLLHPFIPFVTEAVWQVFHGDKASILESTI